MRLTEAYSSQQIEDIQSLYLEAFPASERKPFSLILEKRKEGVVDILALEGENHIFQGLAIIIQYKDMALLDYFAISPQVRGKGLGSVAFQMLKERYTKSRFFLEIERTGVEAENILERIRRKEFYLRNGMKQGAFCVELYQVEMELLTNVCDISFEEYYNLYVKTFGKEKVEGKIKLIK